MESNTTIGRPWYPADIDNEFSILHLLGHEVRGIDAETGHVVQATLANVDSSGIASFERDGFCVALVRAETVQAAV